MKKYILLISLFGTFLLAACNGGVIEEAAAQTDSSSRLTENYDDALSVQEQLIIGTFNLEETEMAVDEAQAQTLLPLWRALQSLTNSAATADAELTAVVNQIQDNMNPEQIEAIAAMQLTADDIQTAVQNNGLRLRGGGPGNEDGGANAAAIPRGGFGGQAGGGFGGPPGDGIGGRANADPGAQATRQAVLGEEGIEGQLGNALINPLVILLEVRAGEREAPEPDENGFARGGLFAQAIEIIAEETGLTTEEIQAETVEGSTLSEIIKANGGDVETIRAALVNAMTDIELPEDSSLEELIDNILG